MNGLSDVRLVLDRTEFDVRDSVRAVGVAQDSHPTTLLGRLKAWRLRVVTRRQLLTLDADQLKDIGITRVDAYAEGIKPFWRE